MANALDRGLKAGVRTGRRSAKKRLQPVAQVTVYDERCLVRMRASLRRAGFPGVVAFWSVPTEGPKAVPPALPCWKVFVTVDDRWPAFRRWLRSFGLIVLGNVKVRRNGSQMEYTALAPR